VIELLVLVEGDTEEDRRPTVRITTMIDLYGLPQDFPSRTP
jgi:hypothetical protein